MNPKRPTVPIYTPTDFALPDSSYPVNSTIDLGIVVDVMAAFDRSDTEFDPDDDKVTVVIDVTDAHGNPVINLFEPDSHRRIFPKNGPANTRTKSKEIRFRVKSGTSGDFRIRVYNQYLYDINNAYFKFDSFTVPGPHADKAPPSTFDVHEENLIFVPTVPIYTPVDFTPPNAEYQRGANIEFAVGVNTGNYVPAGCEESTTRTLVADVVYADNPTESAAGNFQDNLPIVEYQPPTPWDIQLHLSPAADTTRAYLIRVLNQCSGAGVGYNVNVT